MKILKVDVDYMLGYGNAPRITLTVDEFPKFDPLNPIWNYEEDTGYVWTEIDDVINYIVFAQAKYTNTSWNGFGGREFTYDLKDKTRLHSNNWWSGGAYGLVASGIECIDVNFVVGDSTSSGVYGNYRIPGVYAMRIEKIKELLPDETFFKEKLGELYSWEIKKPS